MDRAAREAIPGPLASWRPLWDHAAAIGARFVIIDPVALAGQWDGYSALPVGAFIAAIRRELRALTDPCGALLVCHTTKAARFGVQEADRTGAEAIIGSARGWIARARRSCSTRYRTATGRKRLSVAKANYAAQRILCDVQSVNQTRDTTHGCACRTAPLHVCRKRPFATQADRLRPRLKGGWLQSAVIH